MTPNVSIRLPLIVIQCDAVCANTHHTRVSMDLDPAFFQRVSTISDLFTHSQRRRRYVVSLAW